MILRRLARLTRSQRLAVLALVLGLGALLIGDPGSGGRVTLEPRELAALVEGEVDHVTPEELAAWIIEGRQDFRLVDLRSDADYAAYRVPGAERIPITGLEDAGLPRNEKIVLYSQEGIHSAQAWFLLKARRYPAVYILLGGLAQWQEQVLFPIRPEAGASESERAAFEKAAARARHFGGTPRIAAAAGVLALP
ncbi:MAG: rhodanese-like domain-containing protein, partial [Thermoanaerobaculia bacterium]